MPIPQTTTPAPSPVPVAGLGIPAPDLAAKVALLSRPAAYPEPTSRVQPVETHMSWVFLLDRHAYKLKKPVRLPYLDFSTVALRRHYCGEEVRLNRRLSDGIYLGVVPLVQDDAGTLRLGTGAAAVDWLVRMRRLPAGRMLDRLIADGTLTSTDLARAVTRLAWFYRASPHVATTPDAYVAGFAHAIDANAEALAWPAYGLPAADVDALCSLQHAALARLAPLLAARAGRVVEAHGDLRPEHVCVDGEPQVIDALEFSRDLRLLDPADELGFLALECERQGAAWARDVILATYSALTGDVPPDAVVAFYQSHRACVRARLAAWHLDDDGVRERAQWTARAAHYLYLARRWIDACASGA